MQRIGDVVNLNSDEISQFEVNLYNENATHDSLQELILVDKQNIN